MPSAVPRRTPQGVRGLKFSVHHLRGGGGRSHPARGAWIEIRFCARMDGVEEGRTPQGVRGLK